MHLYDPASRRVIAAHPPERKGDADGIIWRRIGAPEIYLPKFMLGSMTAGAQRHRPAIIGLFALPRLPLINRAICKPDMRRLRRRGVLAYDAGQ